MTHEYPYAVNAPAFGPKQAGPGKLVCPDCTGGVKRGLVGGYVKCQTCHGTGEVLDPRGN